MGTNKLAQTAAAYMQKLCCEIGERSVGSEGNRRATKFFERELASLGWDTETQEFDAMDWEGVGAFPSERWTGGLKIFEGLCDTTGPPLGGPVVFRRNVSAPASCPIPQT